MAERFFRRKEFLPEPHGTNVLFSYYAQHYNHQFFRTDKSRGPGFTMGNDGVLIIYIIKSYLKQSHNFTINYERWTYPTFTAWIKTLKTL